MKLIEMILDNFQGIKHLELDFDGSPIISGKNATGKTTIANAYSWLLTGKPIDPSQTGYTPKTREGDEEAHHLEHSVSCTFLKDDYGYFTLKKVFKEKYQKVRGRSEETFKGHVTEYLIDDVPVKESDYKSFLVDNIADISAIPLFITTDAFANLKWQDRRAMLMDICGELNDIDLIESDPEISDLKAMLLKPGTDDMYYSIDDYMAKTKAAMAKVNREITSDIPARISEAKKAIPEDADQINAEKVNESLSEIDKQKQELMSKRDELTRSDGSELKAKAVSELKSKMESARLEYMKEVMNTVYSYTLQRDEADTKVADIQAKVSSVERSIRNSENDLEYTKQRRDELITQWKKVSAEKWQGDEVCPTCGQQLPKEQIEASKKRFNLEKSKRLEDINKMGQEVSQQSIKDQEDFITKLKNELTELGTMLILAKQEATAIKAPEPAAEWEDTDTYKALAEELQAIEKQFDQESANREEIDRINAEISRLSNLIADAKGLLFRKDVADHQISRVEELEAELKTLAERYEEMQKGIYLCELFVQKKVTYLDSRIASLFRTVRFRMFKKQVNGGLAVCCDVMIPNERGDYVPWADANNASRIIAGLEIVRALGEQYDVNMPVFIDNAEGIDHVVDIEGMQIIALVVERNDDSDVARITL